MTAAALATLDRDPHGFFLMVEGGRIDHGGHANSLTDVVAETLAFDDAVAYAVAWSRGRGNVTVMVTADHETGGLEILEDRPAGMYPPRALALGKPHQRRASRSSPRGRTPRWSTARCSIIAGSTRSRDRASTTAP